MRRASPGRAARIVISLMAAHCARFCRTGEGVNRDPEARGSALADGIAGRRRYVRGMTRRWFYVLGYLGRCLAALLSTVPLPGRRPKPRQKPAELRPAGGKRHSDDPTAGHGGSWTAYASGEKSGRICYLVGQPEKTDSAGIARKPPVAMVTHRPSENITNVVSFVAGYPLKTGSDVALEVGKEIRSVHQGRQRLGAHAPISTGRSSALAAGRTAIVKGTPRKRQADDRHLFARRLRQGARADRQGVRRRSRHQSVLARQAAPSGASSLHAAKAATPRKATGRKHKTVPRKTSKKKKSQEAQH